MKIRTTAILLLVAVAIGAYILLFERDAGEAEGGDLPTATSASVLALDVASVAGITLERPATGERTELSNEDGTWYVVQPSREEADQSRADALARSLASLRAVREIGAPPDGPSAYGLQPATLRVTLRQAEGGTHVLLIGEQTTTGSGRYAQVEGGEAVYVIAEYLAADVEDYLAAPPYRPTPTPEPTHTPQPTP